MTNPSDSFTQALRRVAVGMIVEQGLSEDDINKLLQDVWETWNEEEAEWRDKYYGFDHEYETVWILTYPLGDSPLFTKITKNELPQNWVGYSEEGDDNGPL